MKNNISTRFHLFDVPIDSVSLDTIIDSIITLSFSKKKQNVVCCLNVHNVVSTFSDIEYKKIVQQADLVIPDGWGVIWACKWLGYSLPHRVTTMDYLDDFFSKLIKEHKTIFFLGATQSSIYKALQHIEKQFPKLQIAGYHHGYDKDDTVIKKINTVKPDFLILGMGTPRQEKWLGKHIHELDIDVGWGIGAAFDYYSGVQKLCPRWIGKLGLEWLWRFILEPRRLGRRYIVENIIFMQHFILFLIKKSS